MKSKLLQHSFQIGVALLLIMVWELGTAFIGRNNHLIPPFSRVVETFIEMFQSGEFIKDLLASVFRAICGFLLGAFGGIGFGILTGRNFWLRMTLGKLIYFLRSIPAIGFVPLAIIWFGIGEFSKIFLVAWAAIFPIWMNTYIGVSKIEPQYIWAAQSLGASGKDILRTVVFPYAIPFILAGLRVSIGLSFIALVAAEMAGAFSGIGHRMMISHLNFRTDKIIVGLCTLGILGVGVDKLFVWITRKLFPWSPQGEEL